MPGTYRYALLLLNGKSKCYCLSLIASHTIESDCCLPYSYQHSLLCLVNLHKIKQAAVSSTGLCAVCFQIYIYTYQRFLTTCSKKKNPLLCSNSACFHSTQMKSYALHFFLWAFSVLVLNPVPPKLHLGTQTPSPLRDLTPSKIPICIKC